MVDAYFANFPDRVRNATLRAWRQERLAILHDFGAHYGGQVLQIVNRTDLALDFGPEPRLPGTAFRPFAGLYKSQIRLLGQDLGIPTQIQERRPSLDSYPGQSDEGELGAAYESIDAALDWRRSQGRSRGGDQRGLAPEVMQKVQRLEKRSARRARSSRLGAAMKPKPACCTWSRPRSATWAT
jgi:NAD+ synthase